MREDIFDLTVSDKEKDFVNKVCKLELDIISDILEELKGVRFIGSLIKIGRIGANYLDLHFVRKIARFLKRSEDIPVEKKEAFLDKLDKKQRQKLYEHLVHFLYVAESDDKAEIMGILYRERVLDQINDNLFLRLCAVVNNSYVEDLKQLGQYKEPTQTMDYVGDNLSSCGLISTYMDQRFSDGKLALLTSRKLNAIGEKLHGILCKAQWL